ncbi:hypothetical protein NCCP1664_06790 [Zafaria cholistanensis]|uniref:Endolytic murein transglycosylase n=1 Tax=Zafaria cholistanensis TaxID=1682741 RepID=A0A5A7NPV7_9MICC|nr:endolytic transglycosylase MltG [Zafaria cholistanensis]GER22182.1 hypothetical protein NCCP1664_06790 [Zafaria cholistanensis]
MTERYPLSSAGAASEQSGPPFRRLSTGRRRLEPTAPYDAAPDEAAPYGAAPDGAAGRDLDVSGQGLTPAPPSAGVSLAPVPAAPTAAMPAAAASPRRRARQAREQETATGPLQTLERHPGPVAVSSEPEGPPDPAAGPSFDGPHDAGHHEHRNHEHRNHAVRLGHAGRSQPAGDGPAPGHVLDEGYDDGHGREHVFLPGHRSAPSVRRQRRRRRNIVMLVVLGIFVLGVVGMATFIKQIIPAPAVDYPGPGTGEVTFTVEGGWGPIQIGRRLAEQDIVASEDLFLEALGQVEAESREIHPGEYQLKHQMRAIDAATVLVGGDNAKVHYVAIKQNVRTGAVFTEISAATGIPAAELEKLNTQPELFGLDDSIPTLEGYLHPGEYRFPLETDAQGILQLMVDATLKELTGQGVTDPQEQYRILKIASILQAEALPADYATVAGALENRLSPDNTETNGLLQVDSTVIYGLDRYSLQMTAEEKADAGNPYNTYVHKGLPPTPIGSPANTAIEAAISPQENDYYYWVTVDSTTGETKFARTYAEHLVNQEQFRRWCAANTDVCK